MGTLQAYRSELDAILGCRFLSRCGLHPNRCGHDRTVRTLGVGSSYSRLTSSRVSDFAIARSPVASRATHYRWERAVLNDLPRFVYTRSRALNHHFFFPRRLGSCRPLVWCRKSVESFPFSYNVARENSHCRCSVIGDTCASRDNSVFTCRPCGGIRQQGPCTLRKRSGPRCHFTLDFVCALAPSAERSRSPVRG